MRIRELDGVPGISQPPVKKGETFTYDFIVPDASLYWYHPHVLSNAQVGFGLYGALLVEDPDDPVGLADETTFVLSDIGFDSKGVLEDPESGGSAGMVFGREGAYVLVNGRTRPTLKARPGAPQRWRIVNSAKSRFFYLDLDGQEFTLIGEDGCLQASPTKSSILLVTPGERKDVIVRPTGKAGSELTLRAMLYNRGYGSIEYRSVEDIMTIAFTDDPPVTKYELPKISRTLTPPPLAGATPVPVVFTLAAGSRSQRVPHQRRAVLEGPALQGEDRRDAAVDGEERHRLRSPVPHARLLLHGGRREGNASAAAGVEGHGQPPAQDHCPIPRHVRQPAGHVDAALPKAEA